MFLSLSPPYFLSKVSKRIFNPHPNPDDRDFDATRTPPSLLGTRSLLSPSEQPPFFPSVHSSSCLSLLAGDTNTQADTHHKTTQ